MKQQDNRNKLIQYLDGFDMQNKINEKYLQLMKIKITSDWHELIDGITHPKLIFKSDDVIGDYTKMFHLNTMYKVYFQLKEDYEYCNLVNSITNLHNSIMKKVYPDFHLVIDYVEEETIKIINEDYGTEF